jgi:DNA polymerase-1
MLQFGTTSGRYASRNPNLQNQPRIKEDEGEISAIVLKYTNLIKKGFIAPKGYKIVNADYSSLEPICFSHMSNSESLRNVFRKGEDLYSRVAIDVNHLENEYSANKKADNFLKKHKPELRQLWKVPPLGIVYGMGEARLMQAIGCDYNEAKHIITSYLNTYPELKKYMFACDFSARTKGYVKTQFGRIRHLPRAKQLFSKYGEDLLNFKWAKSKNLLAERRELKNLLNNAKNFPIQALAAHIVNRGAIATVRNFKNNNITGWLAIQVHDELTTIVKEEQAELASKLLKEAMEQTTQISVPLTAVPVIGINWAESK